MSYWINECCRCVYFDDDFYTKIWTGEIAHYCDKHYTFVRATNDPCSEYYIYSKRTDEEVREFEEEVKTGIPRPKKIEPMPRYNYNYNYNNSYNDDSLLDWISEIAEKHREKKKNSKVKKKKK